MIALGSSPRLGTFIRLRDSYGNTYTYGHLAKLATVYPVAAPAQAEPAARSAASSASSASDPAPRHAASAGGADSDRAAHAAPTCRGPRCAPCTPTSRRQPPSAPASPAPAAGARRRPGAPRRPRRSRPRCPSRGCSPPPRPGSAAARQLTPLHPDAGASRRRRSRSPTTIPAGVSAFRAVFAEPEAIDRRDVVLKPLRRGAKVIGGTVIGRIGAASLELRRPAGRRRRGRAARRDGRRRAPEAPPPRRTSTSRSAPPAPRPRGSTPSRCSTAGACSTRPRSTARRTRC